MTRWAPIFILVAVCARYVGSQDLFQCAVCGDGSEVSVPNAIIVMQDDEDRSCNELTSVAERGLIAEDLCPEIQTLTTETCGCVPSASITNDIAAPIESPTVSPPSSCITDLKVIVDGERSLVDTSEVRTYILCPNTDFKMGVANPETQWADGFPPVQAKINSVIKCGDVGLATNNCRFHGGDWAITMFPLPGDPAGDSQTMLGTTFQGITFDGLTSGSVLLPLPGEVSFVNCVFVNNYNLGAVRILYGSSTPESAPRLVVRFQRTIFESNGLPSNFDSSLGSPGLVTSDSDLAGLIFEDCMFRNNNFGDSSVSESTWAVNSRGPVTIKNTCFQNNQFLRQSPVVAFDGEIASVNNFVETKDDDLLCNLLAVFDNSNSLRQLTNFTCIDPDAVECAANLPEEIVLGTLPPKSPTQPPTPAPIGSKPTLSPTDSKIAEVPQSGSSGQFYFFLHSTPTLLLLFFAI